MNKRSMSVSSMENRDHAIHSSETKKNKIIWTPDLHKKFLEAIEKIGVEGNILIFFLYFTFSHGVY